MKNLNKIKVFLFAKFQAILMGLIGLVAGLLYSFGGLFIDLLVSLEWITTTETPGLSYGTILAFGALIGMPIIGAVTGYFIGLAEAVLYNLCARWFGAMKIDFYLS